MRERVKRAYERMRLFTDFVAKVSLGLGGGGFLMGLVGHLVLLLPRDTVLGRHVLYGG